MTHFNHGFDSPGVHGAMLTAALTITSVAAHTLPVVQWLAGVVAIFTGVLSAIRLIRNWRNDT